MSNQLTDSDTRIVALIPAAGIGSRMKTASPKQYLTVAGQTIIEHTLSALLLNPRISQIIIALSPEDELFSKLAVANNPRITTVIGGKQRADSVLAGLDALAAAENGENAWVLVHDAARPCLHQDDLNNIIQLVDIDNCCGGILASPVRDTMKRSMQNRSVIDHTVDRSALWHALTPQVFPLYLLRKCLNKALSEHAIITDEASALEYCGYQPTLVTGRADNLKVTQPEDLALAEFYLSRMNKE
ncbi:2-C-methyl-D-erythritol 4-phosphate cytidylyltransferase [Moellerella wisconsensis]|uniref:2-C-methyl-D-erythritol 4-phosphate cytidylyltransferase n=2 Tax=Moellerella wisconsensis TaxID=158849 RepID=A0ACD3Y8L3_9GAMM|nr:2-C-methyl-D-erythritol 4-phosphate cytidylyltransferase [Moellerella wisconsensis]KLN97964.1 2-C-methyl-D-erythritol 4-phosphate cytidylyltransferase [Moellerella wisconsensis]UNH24737.1 2-C-methyl-D-erythritol 4-phosphate cytidylyltransferase [Moellerella wisconsensis]UNH27844.1 2-C-methyl-D-erythritol 4-phosphate cytidylyltransferase [Moellerella wisconsensis]UNH31340.1 2-C-methyl-D-erythritol 4-phosphate cytidylyltransferase [Moellerella wisconsensis]UNH39463.1 2-C-methyl-D-erythritol 4